MLLIQQESGIIFEAAGGQFLSGSKPPEAPRTAEDGLGQ
jgi:hypothetical protein